MTTNRPKKSPLPLGRRLLVLGYGAWLFVLPFVAVPANQVRPSCAIELRPSSEQPCGRSARPLISRRRTMLRLLCELSGLRTTERHLRVDLSLVG